MFALVQGHTTSEFLKNLVRATKFRGRRKFKNIYPIHSRELRTPRTSSRLYFASSKEENVESPRERSSFSKTVLPLLPPPVFVSATYTASPRFSSSPGGLSRKGRTRPFMGCSFGRAATSPDQPATLVRRNWHQGHYWSLSLSRRLLLRPVPFEIMFSA